MTTMSDIQSEASLEAASLLKRLGIRDIPVNVHSIAQSMGVKVVVDDLDDDTSGVIVIKNNQAMIGVNNTHHPNRQRFTIAHELGHYLLHNEADSVFVDTTYTFRRDGNSTDGIDPREIAANAFAAELLMPQDILKHLLDEQKLDVYDETALKRLAAKFGVSEQALTIRLINLGLISV